MVIDINEIFYTCFCFRSRSEWPHSANRTKTKHERERKRGRNIRSTTFFILFWFYCPKIAITIFTFTINKKFSTNLMVWTLPNTSQIELYFTILTCAFLLFYCPFDYFWVETKTIFIQKLLRMRLSKFFVLFSCMCIFGQRNFQRRRKQHKRLIHRERCYWLTQALGSHIYDHRFCHKYDALWCGCEIK